MKTNKWIIGLINLFLLEAQITVLKLLYFVTSLLRNLQFWEKWKKEDVQQQGEYNGNKNITEGSS